MNRFFSKLDLRDIKIDPAGSRFPPDADDHDEPVLEAQEPDVLDAAEPQAETDAVADVVTPVDEPVASAAEAGRESEPVAARPAYEFSYERTTTTATTSFATGAASWSVEQTETSVVANGHADGALHAIDTASLLGAEFIDAVAVAVDEVLKVSARSRPSAVAGAIAGVVRECGRAEVQAIGAGATNQAVKAVAIARDYLRETGIDAVCLPAFIDVTIENEDRTAIRLVVEVR